MQPAVTPSPDFVGILLAAGAGSRYRAAHTDGPLIHKLLAPVQHGRCVAERAAQSLNAVVKQTIAVVYETPRELPDLLRAVGCTIVPAPQSQRGMGLSLAAGAQYVLEHTPSEHPPIGCVVSLADMPCIQSATIIALMRHATPDTIVVPTYKGRRGHPVVFGWTFIPELATLQGDTGARALLLRYGAIEIECDDAGVLQDIDTPDDLRSLTAAL